MKLVDTVSGMISYDYKARVKAEYQQLCIRYNDLHSAFLKAFGCNENCGSAVSKSLLLAQLKAMNDYKEILEARALIEGIDLEEM